MTELPFYITLEGDNVIREYEIQEFIDNNPELEPYFYDFKIELRLLKIDTLESFSSWIIGQHISSKAADQILKRFLNAFKPLSPRKLLDTSLTIMQDMGLSKMKAGYIHNLANFLLENDRNVNLINSKSEELRKYYTQIKGIGTWTVNMHLIFVLGKKDILAVKDLVVRKGIQKLYNLNYLPNENEVKKICSNWGGLATIGTLLAWEVVEN